MMTVNLEEKFPYSEWAKHSISALRVFLVITSFVKSSLVIVSITRWGNVLILERKNIRAN